jgi:ribosomal protein S18 acetylase RimI-like enzyme
MNIIDINYNNNLHVECIWKLSKKNNFHKDDLSRCLYGDDELYKNNLNYKGLFICEEKKPVGYLLYYIRDNNEYIDLLFILIDKNKRNNGYGSVLVNHLQKKYNETMIIVRIDNNSLEKWYNKHEFYKLKDALNKCIEFKNQCLIFQDIFINNLDKTKMYYLKKW